MNSDTSSSYEIPPAAFPMMKRCHSTQSILEKGIKWSDSEDQKRRRLYQAISSDSSPEYTVLMSNAKDVIKFVDKQTKKRLIEFEPGNERKQKKKKFCDKKQASLSFLKVGEEVR